MIDEAKLISIVEGYMFLYDKSSKHFKDIKMKENAWEVIAASMGDTVDECKRLWKNVRERYVKQKRLNKSVPSGSAATPSNWAMYSSLQFLDEHIKERKTISNIRRHVPSCELGEDQEGAVVLAESGMDDSYGSTEIGPPSEITERRCSISMSTIDSPSPSEVSTPMPPKRPRRDSTPVDVAISNLSVYLKEQSRKGSEAIFGQYVASALQEMPPKKKRLLKANILNLISSALIDSDSD